MYPTSIILEKWPTLHPIRDTQEVNDFIIRDFYPPSISIWKEKTSIFFIIDFEILIPSALSPSQL